MRGRQRLFVEVRGTSVAAFQFPNRHAVFPGAGQSDPFIPPTTDDLPTPDAVASALLADGFTGTKCTLIVPRNAGVLGVSRSVLRRSSELRASATMEIAAATESLGEPVLSAYRLTKSPGNRTESHISWVALRADYVETYRIWLQACGLYVEDVCVAPFASAHSMAERGPYGLAMFYPNGEWDLHFVNDGLVDVTHAGQSTNNALPPARMTEEVARILVLYAIRQLAVVDVTDLVDASVDIELHATTLTTDIFVEGTVPQAWGSGVMKAQDHLAELGLDVEFAVKKHEESQHIKGSATDGLANTFWPLCALHGAAIAYRYSRPFPGRGQRRPLPVVTFAHNEAAIRRSTVSAHVIVWCIALLLTAVMGSRYVHYRTQLDDLHTSVGTATPHSQSFAEVTQAVDNLSSTVGWIESRHESTINVVALLEHLQQDLPPDSRVEQLALDTDRVTLTLVAPAASQVLRALEQADPYRDLSIRTPVATDERSAGRLERVGLEFRYVGAAGEGP